MAIHIDGSGEVNKSNGPIRQNEEVQEEQRICSIFDLNYDGEISTSEQMQEVQNKASTFGDYIDIWASKIARFFQNTIIYVTNSTAAQKATQIVQTCIDNAMKFLQYCVDKGDESPFIKESTELVTNDDGGQSEAPESYTSTQNENGERVINWNNGKIQTYSRENDCLITKLETDGKTYTFEYKEDGSYTTTRDDGTVFRYDANDECISKTNPSGSSYNFSHNSDGSYSTYNADTNTWARSWHKDNSSMGKRTQNGNYKFYPSKEISISEAAEMLGVDESQLRLANPKAAKAGKFEPPNDIYVPKGLLPKGFDPSKVIV